VHCRATGRRIEGLFAPLAGCAARPRLHGGYKSGKWPGPTSQSSHTHHGNPDEHGVQKHHCHIRNCAGRNHEGIRPGEGHNTGRAQIPRCFTAVRSYTAQARKLPKSIATLVIHTLSMSALNDFRMLEKAIP